MTTTSISPSTRLRPPWLYLARLGWVLLVAATLVVFVHSTINTIRQPLPSCIASPCPAFVQLTQEDITQATEIGLTHYFALTLVVSILARFSLAFVGIIIFWRRSDDWVAMIISGALMTVLLEGGQGVDPALQQFHGVLLGVGTALFLPIPFVFPNGRIVSRWLRLPILLITLPYVILVTFFVNAPFYAGITAILTLFWAIFSIYAMAFRYFRRSTPIERQQIKWVLLGISVVFINAIYYSTTTAIYPANEPSPQRIIVLLINAPLYVGLYGFFAFSLLVAMLRYRLWDIDILIRRTLQYTLLTGFLAVVYFVSVVLLQSLVETVSGERSPVVIVLSTLLIAALFSPLRRRIQHFIDRRFFRQKYDAQLVLAQFVQTARDETNMEQLITALGQVVSETMQPDSFNIWLKSGRKQ